VRRAGREVLVRDKLAVGAGAYVSGEEYVSEAVDIKVVEIVFGEIELESATEVLDTPFKFIPVEGCD